jgi:hypothetical protein
MFSVTFWDCLSATRFKTSFPRRKIMPIGTVNTRWNLRLFFFVTATASSTSSPAPGPSVGRVTRYALWTDLELD